MSQWHRLITALGVLFVLVAIVHGFQTLGTTGDPLRATINFALICAPGLAMLYIGSWLPRAGVHPDLYPRIAGWVVAGVVVMYLSIFLRILHPGVSVEMTFGTRAIGVALGSIAGLLIGIRDAQAITRTRQLEAHNEELRRARALARHNEELRRTQRQLEEAVSQLEQSNDQLEQFAAVASHDLREPLRMVSSYLGLVEDRYGDVLDEDGAEFVAYAVDGADRMREMIEGLFEYARMDADADRYGPANLESVLDDALADLRVAIDESDAEITREPLPTVEGDPGQLRHVFQNLIHNAITYSDDRPSIHVSAAETESAWTISVRDAGIGIEPEDRERVFGIFRRLHSADERPGSGIGLALCKRIVERHGGRIWVDSEPGEGSTFRFTIPRCDGPSSRSGDVANAEPADAAAGFHLSNGAV